jgi:hypothetical protein
MSEKKKETRAVVYVGGHYGPEAYLGAGIGYCRVGGGPQDLDKELAEQLVEAKVFRFAEGDPTTAAAEAEPTVVVEAVAVAADDAADGSSDTRPSRRARG